MPRRRGKSTSFLLIGRVSFLTGKGRTLNKPDQRKRGEKTDLPWQEEERPIGISFCLAVLGVEERELSSWPDQENSAASQGGGVKKIIPVFVEPVLIHERPEEGGRKKKRRSLTGCAKKDGYCKMPSREEVS